VKNDAKVRHPYAETKKAAIGSVWESEVNNTGQLSHISNSGTRTQTRPNAPQKNKNIINKEQQHERRRW